MTDFQEWWVKNDKGHYGIAIAKEAFLAGQASAEQRVKWQDDLIQELQAKCAELERERDQWKYTAEIRQQHLEYTIKAQAGEHEEFECPRCSATMVVHLHQTPAKTLIDPEPAYAALLSAKVALCAVNSGASIKAFAGIDALRNAAPAPTKEMK